MQLFELVNVLLKSDPATAHRHLAIRVSKLAVVTSMPLTLAQTYYVGPLSPKLGLIEW